MSQKSSHIQPIHKVDQLTARICQLPVVDSSYSFLISFKFPLDTVWRKGKIVQDLDNKKDLSTLLDEYIIKEWERLTRTLIASTSENQWMLDLKNRAPKIIWCEITEIVQL